MKYQLIMLDNPIIVSDEKIKVGDSVWENVEMTSDEIFVVNEINSITGIGRDDKGTPFVIDSCQKIVAQSHQIDWNGLEDQFGYVDVKKSIKQLAYLKKKEEQKDNPNFEKYWDTWWGLSWGWMDTDFKNSILETFKKAQELNNKKFSLEDMRKAMLFASSSLVSVKGVDNYLNSLPKHKAFDIEVEMESVPDSPFVGGYHAVRPKVTDGKVKIWKKL